MRSAEPYRVQSAGQRSVNIWVLIGAPRGDRRFRRVHLVEVAGLLPVVSVALTSALASTNANHGSPEEGIKRKALNEFIRAGGLFDGVADFDAATLDPQTGAMRAEFVPKARPVDPATRSIQNESATWRWPWRLTGTCSRRSRFPGGSRRL